MLRNIAILHNGVNDTSSYVDPWSGIHMVCQLYVTYFSIEYTIMQLPERVSSMQKTFYSLWILKDLQLLSFLHSLLVFCMLQVRNKRAWNAFITVSYLFGERRFLQWPICVERASSPWAGSVEEAEEIDLKKNDRLGWRSRIVESDSHVSRKAARGLWPEPCR